MPTNNESAVEQAYIFRYKNEQFSKVITYKKNVIREVQQDCNNRNITQEQQKLILSYNVQRTTERLFNRFVDSARSLGYEFYKPTKL